MFRLPRISEFQKRRTVNPCFEPAIAKNVVLVLIVLLAVTFHDRSMCQTSEVDEEAADNNLPSIVALETTPTQSDPQDRLRLGHVFSHFTAPLLEDARIGLHPPTVRRSAANS